MRQSLPTSGRIFPILSVITLLLLGACRAPTVAPRPVGELHYVGSSTIAVFVRDAERAYGTIRFDFDTTPESAGGEQAILASRADLAGVARAPRPETIGAGVIATLIGRDAIAVIVNARNPVTDLSREELRGIFTGAIENWREVGGPDLPVRPFIVGEESATRGVFAASVLQGSDYAGCKEAVPDSSILDAVAGDPGAVGQISFSFLGDASGVRPVAVDGQLPAVTNFAYPISRPLYLLWRDGNPVVEGFVTWARGTEGQSVLMRHFVGARVVGSVRSNREPDPTGTLIVFTETYSFYDGGINYHPHGPYEIYDTDGGLVRRVVNHRGENDETPMRVELLPGTYLIRARSSKGRPAEFFVTIDAGKVTELDVVGLLNQAHSSGAKGPPPGSAVLPGVFDNLKFYGDLRLRGESEFELDDKRGRSRMRTRLRFGVNYRINDEFLVGTRIATGDPGDPNSPHVTFGDMFDSFELSLDRAFLTYHPLSLEGAWATIGKFNHPFERNPVYSELVWDADVQPEGFSLGRAWRGSDFADRLTVALGGYTLLERADAKDSFLLVGQVSGATELGSEVDGQLSVGYYHYTNVEGTDAIVGDNAGNAETAGGEYVSDFGVLNPVMSVDWNSPSGPLTFSAEYIHNLRAKIDRDRGWAAGVSYGNLASRGDWRAYYQWQVIEQDAVFSAFAQDDFLFGTNYRGHALGVRFLLTDKIGLHLWGLIAGLDHGDPTSPTMDSEEDQWRVRLDLDIKF